MNKIEILDCTLRDGGYINDFAFTERGIKKIINQLTIAGIDIVECGFLEDGNTDKDCSLYTSVERIKDLLPTDHRNTMFVAMACFGEYDLSQLSDYDGSSIDGIRVTFHYNEIEGAIDYCKQIMDKGYKVFVQPVGTTSYTDEQLLGLITTVNELQPYAFYLVDTLGLMHQNDVLRFFYLIDHNLKKSIHMGFHSHNNLQLSYSNCQALVSVESDRTISLDSSVYGMGRGAGNLNTELIASYLNDHRTRKYEIEPILEIVDEFIINIKKEHEWGYSVPYYLAAINGCHPNYAGYLSGKQTLNVKSISTILRMIEPEQRSLFNKELAEQKYREFQTREIDDSLAIAELQSKIEDRNVILLAPGPSLKEHIEDIKAKSKACVVISASFVPDFMDCDYTFLSNLKRYNTTFNPTKKKLHLIHTSNVRIDDENTLMVNYSSLINEDDIIMDNTSLMLLNMLCKINPHHVYIAGMDGYKVGENNFYQDRLHLEQDKDTLLALNSSISHRLQEISKILNIEFITPTNYEL